MQNPITITLSYTARMLIAATGNTPPTAYRIDLYDAAPEHVTAHAEEHDITTVTVTADDIQTHGSVTRAAVGILTDAAPEPAATEPQPTAEDVTRAYENLVFAAYMYEYRANIQNFAKVNRARHALSMVLSRRGHSEQSEQMFTEHATSEGRYHAAERIYHADAARRAADRGMNPNASQPTSAERRDAQSMLCAHMTRHLESRLRDARRLR